MNTCEFFDLEALAATPLKQDPYPHLLVPNFIKPEQLAAIQQDYPQVPQAGSYPLSALTYGSKFQQFMAEIEGPAMRAAIAAKFGMDLTQLPVYSTVRGKADHKDGKIHTDSKSKVITFLLYMNENWQPDGGRLRLLYDNKNLESYALEVPPTAGTLLLFKVTDNCWHGHKTFIGTRKVIQMNYLTDAAALEKHLNRHRFSAKMKNWAQRLGFSPSTMM